MASPLPLSPWARAVAPSPTLAVDAKVKALQAAGHDILSFGTGEPDFDTPDFIKEAAAKALAEGKTKYAPTPGLPALREAMAVKYQRDNAVPGVTAAQIVVSPGGKFSCYLGLLAVVGPGDEVIVPAPYWVSYPEMIKLTGATPVIVAAPASADFKLTAAQLEASITPRTKVLILNSPSNPTGTVYTRAELEALMEVVLRHNLYVLADEMYEYLLYDGAVHYSPASFSPELAARVITVAGFSKTFAMTGWRLGTLMAPKPIAAACADLQSQLSSNATTFAQYGALAAATRVDEARAAVAEMLTAFDRRRLRLWEGLNALPGIRCRRSEGAFYLFPDVSALGLSSEAFAGALLEEQKMAVVPGNGFGDDQCVRLSYATADSVIDRGLERLAAFLKSRG